MIDLLCIVIGIAYLQLFISANFLGPKVEPGKPEPSISEATIHESLTCDGVTPVATIEHAEYLFQALTVFQVGKNNHWVRASPYIFTN